MCRHPDGLTPRSAPPLPTPMNPTEEEWSCSQCTFNNPVDSALQCAMCGAAPSAERLERQERADREIASQECASIEELRQIEQDEHLAAELMQRWQIEEQEQQGIRVPIRRSARELAIEAGVEQGYSPDLLDDPDELATKIEILKVVLSTGDMSEDEYALRLRVLKELQNHVTPTARELRNQLDQVRPPGQVIPHLALL